ncbi:benzoate transporter [Actinomadura craniellae]|uniref:Benzoate transporter n=1 Tax=Actinomadura craniellae TaxID=2231787 RepID=A0A365H025_9ACTN|nr:beta-propeller domain-containing protein [Actinomadura craniellae]RAY12445.1 benzoate transporter [Actinomadura craniellae]
MRPRRPLATALAAALAAGCLGGDAFRFPAAPDPPIRLVGFPSCVALLTELRRAAEPLVGPYGLPGDGPIRSEGRAAAGAAPAAPSPPAYSGTTVHEAGVDEPDQVKTDGRRIVALSQERLLVIDAASRRILHRLPLPGVFTGDLLLSGDRALVIVRDEATGIRGVPRPGRTRLLLVDLAGAPRVLGELSTRAHLVDARQTGTLARIVVRSGPRFGFPTPGMAASSSDIVQDNRRHVRTAPLDAWLPAFEVRTGAAPPRTVRPPCDRVSRPAAYTGTSMLTVLTVDLTGNLRDLAPVSIAAAGDTVYATATSLYIAGAPPLRPGPADGPRPRFDGKRLRPEEQHTDVHRFEVAGPGGRLRHTASGSVPGTLIGQYALSEHDGRLRVATTRLMAAGTGRAESEVTVLERHGSRLAPVGRIGGLGRGEHIYAVRFVGDLGYVVTFRQIDPLYALDLRDPRAPRLTGELKITGYSSHLLPVAPGRLLGVGQDADRTGRPLGVQVSLFDVTGPPRKVAGHQVPGTGSEVESDPHALLYWPPTGLAVVPVTSHREGTGQALVLAVRDGGISLTGTLRHPRGLPIRRALVIGDTLWTISGAGARAHHAGTLATQGWLAFRD